MKTYKSSLTKLDIEFLEFCKRHIRDFDNLWHKAVAEFRKAYDGCESENKKENTGRKAANMVFTNRLRELNLKWRD